MQPCTSYCLPTRSPRESLGTKEYRAPQWVQKPSVRPALPSRPRPTGLLHSGLPQNRWPSGTCGLVRIAAAGSPLGMRGIVTIPAPSRPRTLTDFDDDPARAVRPDRAVEPTVAVEVATTPCRGSGAGAVPQTSQ